MRYRTSKRYGFQVKPGIRFFIAFRMTYTLVLVSPVIKNPVELRTGV